MVSQARMPAIALAQQDPTERRNKPTSFPNSTQTRIKSIKYFKCSRKITKCDLENKSILLKKLFTFHAKTNYLQQNNQ